MSFVHIMPIRPAQSDPFHWKYGERDRVVEEVHCIQYDDKNHYYQPEGKETLQDFIDFADDRFWGAGK